MFGQASQTDQALGLRPRGPDAASKLGKIQSPQMGRICRPLEEHCGQRSCEPLARRRGCRPNTLIRFALPSVLCLGACAFCRSFCRLKCRNVLRVPAFELADGAVGECRIAVQIVNIEDRADIA